MADDNQSEGVDESETPSIFDLFEPPPEPDPSSFGKVPVVRGDDDDFDRRSGTTAAERKTAAEAEAAGLQHWTAPATGQVPHVLASEQGDELWSDVKGPSWQSDDPTWSGPDLADVLGGSDDDLDGGSESTVPGRANETEVWSFDDDAEVEPLDPSEGRRIPGTRTASRPEPLPTEPLPTEELSAEELAPTPTAVAAVPSPSASSSMSSTGDITLASPGPRVPSEPRLERSDQVEPADGPNRTRKRPARDRQTLTDPVTRDAQPTVAPAPEPTRRGAIDSTETSIPSPPTVSHRTPSSVAADLTGPMPEVRRPRPALLSDQSAHSDRRPEETELPDDAPTAPGLFTGSDAEDRYFDGGDEAYHDDFDLDESSGRSGRNLPQAVGAGVVLAGIVLGALWFGPEAMLLVVVVAALLSVIELYNAMRLAGLRPATLLGLFGTVALPVAAYLRGDAAFTLAVALSVVFGVLWYLAGADDERPVLNLSLTILGVLWIGGLGAFAALILRSDDIGAQLILSTIVLTVVSDTMAYVGGRAYGKKPFHSVSPNKTWEGTLTGFVFVVFTAFAMAVMPFETMWDGNFLPALLLGVVVGLLAPLGDLAESLVKRDLGVKDMGTIIPGHGGLLDRIDALLFTLPGAYYLALSSGLL